MNNIKINKKEKEKIKKVKVKSNTNNNLKKKNLKQLGGDCGAPGCTDGSLGNLANQFINIGKDTVDFIFDIGGTMEWMIVDMPQELVGAIENPSVNTPLTNII